MDKICSICKETKPLEKFARAKQLKSGYRTFCKACAVQKAMAWDKANPEKVKERELRRRLKNHGVNLDSLGERKCGACGSDEKLCIDHDHNCCAGTYGCDKCVRGWLCRPCNFALGLLKDSPERLLGLHRYITSSAFVG